MLLRRYYQTLYYSAHTVAFWEMNLKGCQVYWAKQNSMTQNYYFHLSAQASLFCWATEHFYHFSANFKSFGKNCLFRQNQGELLAHHPYCVKRGVCQFQCHLFPFSLLLSKIISECSLDFHRQKRVPHQSSAHTCVRFLLIRNYFHRLCFLQDHLHHLLLPLCEIQCEKGANKAWKACFGIWPIRLQSALKTCFHECSNFGSVILAISSSSLPPEYQFETVNLAAVQI